MRIRTASLALTFAAVWHSAWATSPVFSQMPSHRDHAAPSDRFYQHRQKVLLTPFTSGSRGARSTSLELVDGDLKSLDMMPRHDRFDVLLRQTLAEYGVPVDYDIDYEISTSPASGKLSAIVRFSLDKVSLCRYYANFHVFADGSRYLVGELPADASLPDPSQMLWDVPEASLAGVAAELASRFDTGSQVDIESSERCLYRAFDSWWPAYELMLLDEHRHPYQAFAGSDQVFFLQSMALDVQGQVQGYTRNVTDGTLATDTVELNGTGFLDSAHFTTAPASVARAQAADFIFTAGPGESGFAEQNVFFHANRMLQWFIGLGFSFTGEPIRIELHQEINSSVNNALYLPPTQQTTYPRILVGDGDGQILANLALDGDVVSHELGHHIVFNYLKSTAQVESQTEDPPDMNHSLALHEGLADFFTFARTGDACLGESICPGSAENSVCYVPAQCLRTASHSVTYRSAEYWAFDRFAHLKGQVISGFLWAMRIGGTMTAAQLDQLVFKSLEFFPVQAVYQDFIAALLAADKDLYAEQFHCYIQQSAKGWGFTTEVERIGQEKCGGPGPAAPVVTTTAASTGDDDGDSGKSGFCAVAAGASAQASGLLYLLALLWPAVQLFRRRRDSAG